MEIYTTYFAQVRNLPSSIYPVSIAAFPPKGWAFGRMPELAPTPAMLQKFKSTPSAPRWSVYTVEYSCVILQALHPVEVVEKLERMAQGRDVALVCFEKAPGECHRSIVAEWLMYAGYPVTEWHK